MSHKLTNEEIFTNIKDQERKVAVGDSVTLSRTKCGNWHGFQKPDKKVHCMTFSDKAVIIGPQENLFRNLKVLQKGFQVKSEGKVPILKKT